MTDAEFKTAGRPRLRWPRCLTFPRPPDLIVGGADDPYLRRWWVFPRNRLFNIYLHNFRRSDDARALHDHHYANVSVLLRGRYAEHLADGQVRIRRPFLPVFRRAATPHRVELFRERRWTIETPPEKPVWSLFLTGPRIREWGFHCPQGWRHWRDFTAPGDYGQTGRGCD